MIRAALLAVALLLWARRREPEVEADDLDWLDEVQPVDPRTVAYGDPAEAFRPDWDIFGGSSIHHHHPLPPPPMWTSVTTYHLN